MPIYWRLDEEDGVDPENLLGDISLVDAAGNRLEETTTFIDTFYLGLADGLAALATCGEFQVELLDEPPVLLFMRTLDRVIIKYKGISMEFDYEEVVADVINSYRDLYIYIGHPVGLSQYEELNKKIATLSVLI